jgi:hypothetical protein
MVIEGDEQLDSRETHTLIAKLVNFQMMIALEVCHA